MSPFDRAHTTSYSTLIETMHLSCTVFAIHTHTHICLTAVCPGLPGWAGTRKVKPIWILLKQETVGGSGISCAISKSAPRSRQITMPAPHHSVFTGRMPFLPPNQQRQSTEGNRFRDIASCLTKVADFDPPHLNLAPPQGVILVEFRWDLWHPKTRVPGLSCGVVSVILRLAVLVELWLVMDGHRAMASTADA